MSNTIDLPKGLTRKRLLRGEDRIITTTWRENNGKKLIYQSTFSVATGSILRVSTTYKEHNEFTRKEISNTFPLRFLIDKAFIPSPSPELIDISITNKCGFGCDYCYQDSIPKGEHAPDSHVKDVINAFWYPPYQVAIGGGEPTQHPAFTSMLKDAYDLGVVPNYTTAGHIFKNNIIDATNKYCGGVALTYHTFKGANWFFNKYRQWDEALTCQKHIHLIANENVLQGLSDLLQLQKELGKPLNVVLLAYNPEVGRGSLKYFHTKQVYNDILPKALNDAISRGMRIAFSEGLLPYFLSRPDIKINTDLSIPLEGVYSCYVDSKGNPAFSSFDVEKTKPGKTLQGAWLDGFYQHVSTSSTCDKCPKRNKCMPANSWQLLTCAHQTHNRRTQ